MYVVQNQSNKAKTLIMQPIAGIAQIAPCQLAPKGQSGDQCILNLAINGNKLPKNGIHDGPILCQANLDNSPNPNQCYRPSAANILNINQVPVTAAAISVAPTTLLFEVNSTGSVTVTNNAGSLANNIMAIIPTNSNITMQHSTCGASLAVGANCIITFTASAQEGPTSISIAGDNTNTVNMAVTVTTQPIISLTAPTQPNRVVGVSGTSLSLVVVNDISSLLPANMLTVSNKGSCTNLVVNDSNCNSVAPGNSCTLELSSNTPYAPCTITISGNNTANSLTTLIAFSYLGGLVFEENGGSGKIVSDVAQGFTSQWTASPSNISNAIRLDDGASNTDDILANIACSGNTNGCAAYKCRSLGAVWYLPAINELVSLVNVLCSNASIPCNFGGFVPENYWSSSQLNTVSARNTLLPSSTALINAKIVGSRVRCIRSFS